MNRRQLLLRGFQGSAALGIAKALHNTTVGYGHFGIGDNLKSQELQPLLAEGIRIPYSTELQLVDQTVRVRGSTREYRTSNTWHPIEANAPEAVLAVDRAIEELVSGTFSASFHDPAAFFAYCDGSTPNPAVVELIRGDRLPPADPDNVEAFTGADPKDSRAIVTGLVDGYRTHGRYDIPRYIAGAIEDNLIFGRGDLREPFRPEESIEALLEADRPVGLFCTELTRLGIRSVHATPASTQSPPIFGFYVRNRRHKHAYSGFGSAVVTDDGLHLPITFVDYTHTTLYNDLAVDRVIGTGFDAYTSNHRADQFIF